MSERRSCRVLDAVRSTIQYRSRRPDDALLRTELVTGGIVALPDREHVEPNDDFWIAAGCYGFVATHLVDVGRLRREVYPIAGDSREFVCRNGWARTSRDLVYDPTVMLRRPGARHVFVLHGYGVGLAALDPATGEFHHCWIRGPGKQPYCFISGVVPCGTAPIAWGHSKDGDFVWRVGEPPVMMTEPPGPVIAVYPHALLCASHEGDALLWCDLPPY